MMADTLDADVAAMPECDMVMKGGITSGVVYPGAIHELSKKYRFRGLGGASAGAIAAAMAGAAEYGRSNGGSSFDRLAELPDDLGSNMVARLQPHPSLQRVWKFLLGEIDRSSAHRRNGTKASTIGLIFRTLGFVARSPQVMIAALLGIALALVLGLTQGGWAWAFGILAGFIILDIGFILGAMKIASKSMKNLNANNFGFCDGHTPAPGMEDTVPLTDWLNNELTDMAGLEAGKVLTYADLWGPAATTAYREALAAGKHNPPAPEVLRHRDLDVTMMVTNLGQGRAHKFPFDIQTYFWCSDCLGDYFDADVIRHMKATSQDLPESGGAFSDTCPVHTDTKVKILPPAPDMPLIVGVRISFSFPVLFSAVPLHTIDWTRSDGNRGVKICWFADGGIASNFPMHFFDSMIPARPTFGISLSPVNPDHPNTQTRRPNHKSGQHLRVKDITSLPASFGALLDAMQNWQDRTLQTVPGYRDRVVDVRLAESEGGLNLTMPADVITALSSRGEQAAKEFDDFELDQHRWIRYRVSMSQVARMLSEFDHEWQRDNVDGTPIKDIMSATDSHEEYKQSQKVRGKMAEATDALGTWVAKWEGDDDTDFDRAGESNTPRPLPAFKTSPRL